MNEACEHLTCRIERYHGNEAHWGIRRCADCGFNMGWVASPSRLGLRRDNALKLKKLSTLQTLDEFTKGVCYCLTLSVSPDGRLKLAPKLQIEFERLCAALLPSNDHNNHQPR
jgi:hypothetical protein